MTPESNTNGQRSVTTIGSRIRRRLRAVHLADGGVAIVEFTIAIMPVLCLFFAMIQWSILAYVNLIVNHAANVAARAEAVMLPAMPDNGGQTGTAKDLEKAVTPLFAHVTNTLSVAGISNVSVKIDKQGSRATRPRTP